jgi:uncharacterized protein (DUF427 family)
MSRPLESVWDYPRPPRVEPDDRTVRVVHRDLVIAESANAVRVLETSHPPAFYLPPEDVNMGYLTLGRGRSICEWKGNAEYWDLAVSNDTVPNAAWSYPEPLPAYAALAGWLSFYAGRVDECTVAGEAATPQEGGFYGGWITSEIEGPFKGAPSTSGW